MAISFVSQLLVNVLFNFTRSRKFIVDIYHEWEGTEPDSGHSEVSLLVVFICLVLVCLHFNFLFFLSSRSTFTHIYLSFVSVLLFHIPLLLCPLISLYVPKLNRNYYLKHDLIFLNAGRRKWWLPGSGKDPRISTYGIAQFIQRNVSISWV